VIYKFPTCKYDQIRKYLKKFDVPTKKVFRDKDADNTVF